MTRDEAKLEMKALLRAAWVAGAPAVLGVATAPAIAWDFIPTSPPADGSTPIIAASIRHGVGFSPTQRTLGERPRFDRRGNVIVVIGYPLARGRGDSVSNRLADLVAESFEGKRTPGGVWFRDVFVVEDGAVGTVYQQTVTAEFRYIAQPGGEE